MRCWSDAIAGRVLSIVLASWFLPSDCSMAAQPNKVRISYSSRSNSNTPFIIALNKGFFVEEGLDVELIQVNPRLGATAVLNGDLDFTTTFGTTLRGIIGGVPDQIRRRCGEEVRALFGRAPRDQGDPRSKR